MIPLLSSWRSKIAVAVALLVTAALLVGVVIGPRVVNVIGRDGLGPTLLRMGVRLPGEIPDVFWISSTPEQHAVDGGRLRALTDSLQERGTSAFLVAKGGEIIEEFYGPDFGPNKRHGIAAMGKAATAALVLLIALDKQIVELDDPVWKFIPEWQSDSLRQDVTLRHLVTHSSGIEDVDFTVEHEGWKRKYLESEDARFGMAVREIPITFPPGSQFSYSGVGFYVLAYALGRAFAEVGEERLLEVVREQVMWPMEIPDRDWRISYGDSYQVDGMDLVGLGSGGSYTARALGRIGQTLLQGGRWGDRRFADSSHVAKALRYGGSPEHRSTSPGGGLMAPAMGLGFWLNCDGFWPSLPRDAAIGLGSGEQLLLVIPSLELVVVRLGHSLGPVEEGDEPWQPLDGAVFAPLMAAMPTAAPSPVQVTCLP